MISEKQVDTLKPGNVFRDWLIDVLEDTIRNKRCDVMVYEIGPASHTVCRYEFVGENYSVIAKFYAEQKGSIKSYDPVSSMNREFQMLKKIGQIIDVPKAIAAREDFHCVLVTERVNGKPLYMFIENENDLYGRLTAVAGALRKLHDNTRSSYCKQYEFGHFHNLLDQLHLNCFNRGIYNHLIGEWWYSNIIDQDYGCVIHNDPNPVNYVFDDSRVFVLDFESSWDHANFIHDLGVMAAELKRYFAMRKGDEQKAEPYIGHFLWHYSRNKTEFRKITSALPFFMAMGLLRMAKLSVEPSEANFIFHESIACLKAKH